MVWEPSDVHLELRLAFPREIPEIGSKLLHACSVCLYASREADQSLIIHVWLLVTFSGC